jgi:hypothetical protein
MSARPTRSATRTSPTPHASGSPAVSPNFTSGLMDSTDRRTRPLRSALPSRDQHPNQLAPPTTRVGTHRRLRTWNRAHEWDPILLTAPTAARWRRYPQPLARCVVAWSRGRTEGQGSADPGAVTAAQGVWLVCKSPHRLEPPRLTSPLSTWPRSRRRTPAARELYAAGRRATMMLMPRLVERPARGWTSPRAWCGSWCELESNMAGRAHLVISRRTKVAGSSPSARRSSPPEAVAQVRILPGHHPLTSGFYRFGRNVLRRVDRLVERAAATVGTCHPGSAVPGPHRAAAQWLVPDHRLRRHRSADRPRAPGTRGVQDL